MTFDDSRTAVEKAQAAWGDDLPDWVLCMAEACDGSSQTKVARRLGRTPGLVSQIIHRKYRAGYELIEFSVRGAFMSAVTDCPGMGETITNDVCARWQQKAKIYAGHNAQRVLMFKVCRRCEHYKGEVKL